MAKMGRPLADVDEALVYELAKIHCTASEIAAACGVDVSTITTRFSKILEKGREEGKVSLRRAQFKSALGGNVTMQIWLGKQLLGQSEKVEVINNDLIEETLEFTGIPRSHKLAKQNFNKYYEAHN